MLDRLESIEKRYDELERLIAQPEISTDHEKLQSLAKEQAGIEDLVAKYRYYKTITGSIRETQDMLDDGLDPDMTQLVKEEIQKLKDQQ